MRLHRTQLLNTRAARRILDRARNPAEITLHAAKRFIDDAPKFGIEIQHRDLDAARHRIHAICQKAKQIYRGNNCFILSSPPWFVFYRDDAVITVMHANSDRRH